MTQATVSRDIRELGLEKRRDPLGRPRYAVPGRAGRDDPRETLAALLAQFGRSATAAQNLVVVQSEIGAAPAIARAIDRIGDPDVVGTIAGDDTCPSSRATRGGPRRSPPISHGRSADVVFR